jgi:hypothetical protein
MDVSQSVGQTVPGMMRSVWREQHGQANPSPVVAIQRARASAVDDAYRNLRCMDHKGGTPHSVAAGGASVD